MKCAILDLNGTLVGASVDMAGAASAARAGIGLAELLDPVAGAATALRDGRASLRIDRWPSRPSSCGT